MYGDAEDPLWCRRNRHEHDHGPGTDAVATDAHRRTAITLGFVSLIALLFIAFVALPYFRLDQTQFRSYWPRRWWLLLHIGTGIRCAADRSGAAVAGPHRSQRGISPSPWHGLHGDVLVSSVAAFYLAFHTDFGVIFGAGLSGLAVAWLVTTGMAFTAIRRHLIEQHKE